jgi:hypothetical protein
MRRSSRTQRKRDAFLEAHLQTEQALVDADPTRTPTPADELRRRAEHDHVLWRVPRPLLHHAGRPAEG